MNVTYRKTKRTKDRADDLLPDTAENPVAFVNLSHNRLPETPQINFTAGCHLDFSQSEISHKMIYCCDTPRLSTND